MKPTERDDDRFTKCSLCGNPLDGLNDDAKAIRLLEEWREEKPYRYYETASPITSLKAGQVFGKYRANLLGSERPITKGEGRSLLSAVEDALKKWEG